MNEGAHYKVAVCALFRNSASYVDYFRAVISAQSRSNIELSFSLVEGDSTDDTENRLHSWAAEDPRVSICKRDVEPVADFADRVTKWAMLGNIALEQALRSDCTHLLWCESDLALPFDLLDQLLAEPEDIVAPAIFLGSLFYDTWGFRGLDGTRFGNEPPYHSDFRHHARVQLSSVGSCVLFRRDVFDKGVRFRGTYDNGLLVGVCGDAAGLGFRTFMDSRVAILHPTSLWRRQQYNLGTVEIQCFRPENRAPLELAAHLVGTGISIAIGSVEMSGDHPVFTPVQDIMRAQLKTTPFTIHVRLASEPKKLYALILSDTPESGFLS